MRGKNLSLNDVPTCKYSTVLECCQIFGSSEGRSGANLFNCGYDVFVEIRNIDWLRKTDHVKKETIALLAFKLTSSRFVTSQFERCSLVKVFEVSLPILEDKLNTGTITYVHDRAAIRVRKIAVLYRNLQLMYLIFCI